jgi:hypothetical protein
MLRLPAKSSKPSVQFTGRTRRICTPGARLGEKEVPKDEVKPTLSDEELDTLYGMGLKQLFVQLGGKQIYDDWKKGKGNALDTENIGFDVISTKLCSNVMQKNVYPTAGMVFGHKLLHDKNGFSIWRNEFYKEWDQLSERVRNQINGNVLSKLNAPYCHELINEMVREVSKNTFEDIKNIKLITNNPLPKPDSYDPMKVLRVYLLLGWFKKLESAVQDALQQFNQFLSSPRTVSQSMTRVKPGKTFASLTFTIKNFDPLQTTRGAGMELCVIARTRRTPPSKK